MEEGGTKIMWQIEGGGGYKDNVADRGRRGLQR
jgi:hypothetical protein